VIKSRRMRLAEHVARIGERIDAYRVLVGKPEGTRPLGRSMHKLNSVALVRTRTIPTERPPPVGEVSANFCG